MQDLSEGVFINLANLTLARRDNHWMDSFQIWHMYAVAMGKFSKFQPIREV